MSADEAKVMGIVLIDASDFHMGKNVKALCAISGHGLPPTRRSPGHAEPCYSIRTVAWATRNTFPEQVSPASVMSFLQVD